MTKPWSTPLAGLLLAAAAWSVASCRSRPAPPAHGACRGCNVLLITIDTLRTDRVGAFGATDGLTPTLDRLAGRGLRLTRAYSAAPLTLPSHASILTAVSPPVHGIRANGLFRLGPAIPTLATMLKEAGYRTGAFVGAFVLDARFGLNRGFDVYDDRYGEAHAGEPADSAERRAEDVVKPATAWMVRNEADGATVAGARMPGATVPGATVPGATVPGAASADTIATGTQAPSTLAPSTLAPRAFFAWVHLYDPHEPTARRNRTRRGMRPTTPKWRTPTR
jgi:hypothetical protein